MLDPDLLTSVFRKRGSLRADFVEIFAERSATSAMVMKDGRIVDATSGRDRGAGVRAQHGPTCGFSHTSTLSPAAILRAAQEAVAPLSLGPGPTQATACAPPACSPNQLLDVRGEDDAEARAHHGELLRSVLDLAVAEASQVVSVSAILRTERRVLEIANSQGLHVAHDAARERLAVTVVVGAPASPVSARASIGLSDRSMRLDEHHVQSTVIEAVRRARARESAAPAPVGEMPVVLAPGTGAVLIHEACGHGLEADHLARRSSVFHDMLGKRLGPPGLRLLDDASLSSAWGSFAFDDEATVDGAPY